MPRPSGQQQKSRRDRLAPALLVCGQRSVQLGANFGNALGEQVVGDGALDRLRQDGRGGRDRGVGGGGANVGQRLGFGEGDLALGGLGATGDEVFHLGLGLDRDALGFGLGVRDDLLGLTLGAAALGLVFGEQLGGVFLQTPCLVELGLDALGAVIERRQ